MAQAKQSTAPVSDRPRLYMAFELSAKTWRLASSDGSNQVRQKAIPAGDRDALQRELEAAKKRFKLEPDAEVVSCQEAGRDGFWVHRFVESLGLANVVVDAASMKVDRKARRAKSDRIDARQMLLDLIRHSQGESRVWRVVRIPTVEVEDGRRLHRELGRLKKEQSQHTTRLRSLLATQGVNDRNLDRMLRNLESIETPNGTQIPPALRAEIVREKERLNLIRRPRPTGADRSPSAREWGWVCGQLEQRRDPQLILARLIEHARHRRGTDVERYAHRTLARAQVAVGFNDMKSQAAERADRLMGRSRRR